MTRVTLLVALLAVALVAVSAAAVAKGRLTATITLVTQAPGEATFEVTRSVHDHRDTIWVTNECVDATGAVVVDRDRAVLWGAWDSLVGAVTVPTGGVTCRAYVTTKPWLDKVLTGAEVTYTPVP